jgi:electron transfer flavoprotein beta subunit
MRSMGGPHCTDTLRTGLAMGADRAIHVTTTETLYPLTVAKLLRGLAESEKPNMVLLGKQVGSVSSSLRLCRIMLLMCCLV